MYIIKTAILINSKDPTVLLKQSGIYKIKCINKTYNVYYLDQIKRLLDLRNMFLNAKQIMYAFPKSINMCL